MKKFFLLISISILVASCNTDSSTAGSDKETDEAQKSEEISKEIEERTLKQEIIAADLRSTDQIEDWLGDLATAVNERDFEVSPPFDVDFEGKTYSVTIVNPDGAVQVVRGAIPNWENREEGFRYITRYDELILLEELKKTSEGLEASKYYYTFGRFLEAKKATGENMQALRSAVPKEFDPPADDIRRSPESVMQKHTRLMERIKMSVK